MSFEKLPDDEASYMVKHYQEKAEGGYPAEPTKTESLSGKVGESAAYTTKTYEGFTYKSSLTEVNGTVQLSGTISADGSTVIKLFYERNTVNVTFNLAGGSVGSNAGPIAKTGKYGTVLTAPVPVKTDAVFKGWNPALPSPLLFPAADAEYTAQWTPLYTITFGVDGTPANGTLKATVDGGEIHSGDKVEKDKTVTFTAVPETGCKVKEWKVDGAVVTGNTTDTYTYNTVTEAVAVTVSFEVGSAVLTLSSGTGTIKVMAITFDNNPITVEGCNETSFPSNTQPELHVKSGVTTVVLKGKIIGLICEKNQLTALNVQDCTALQGLNCDENQLKALNVQGLSALKELNCSRNNLTALDVQGLSALQWLNCDENQLKALNVQGLSALEKLNCSRNNLTALDVQGLSKLQDLNCGGNQLTALNVQGLSALERLSCWDNQLTALNVQGLSKLQDLSCEANQLTALDVQGLSKLQDLNCSQNKLTSLNVQGLSNLENIGCAFNQLNAINVQGLSKLQELSCDADGLTDLNVQGLSKLKVLSCVFNQLNAAAFTKLFNDLSQHTESDGATCTLYFEGEFQGNHDGNHRNFTSPPALQTAFQNAKNVKKWKMCKLLLESGNPKQVEIN
ncbi:leucine-rich repeat domain-containing protein [Treponema socranskii]